MRIAAIYNSYISAAWCLSDGMVHTLRKMGHLVLDMPQSGFRVDAVDWWRRIDEINQADLMVMAGPEYACCQRSYSGFRTAHGVPDFNATMASIKCPKLGVYFESRVMGERVYAHEQLRHQFDHNFFPAVQDVEELGRGMEDRCHFLPFSADTDIFFPQGIPRPFSLGFIGHIYPKRQEFLDRFYSTIPDPSYIPLIGHASVEDVEGFNIPESTRRLAWNYNRLRALVCLPTWAQEMVTKIVEGMACGCCVLAPRLTGAAAANMEGYEHGRDLLFYDETPEGLVGVIGLLKADPTLAEAIGTNAVTSVLRKHTLRQRMEFMLSKVGA